MRSEIESLTYKYTQDEGNSNNQIVNNDDTQIKSALSSSNTAKKLSQNASDAVSEWGKTSDWQETGYLLTDGTQLDMSGKNEGAPSGQRSRDHREIVDFYGDSDINGVDAYDIVNLTPTLINKKESIASTAVSAQKRPTTESLTIDNSNISHSDGNVNTKSALSSKSAVTSAPAGENSVFDDKHRKDVIRKLSAVAKQNGVARLDKDSFVTDAMGILEGALQTGIVSDGIVELILTLMF